MESLFEKLLRFLCLAAIVGVVVAAAIIIWPKYARSRGLERERDQVRREIAETEREIADLREKEQRFRDDPEFVEAIARRQRRIFPGELVFVFER